MPACVCACECVCVCVHGAHTPYPINDQLVAAEFTGPSLNVCGCLLWAWDQHRKCYHQGMPQSREKVSKHAHFFSESWPWLYLSIRDKYPSLPQWPLVFRSHQNSAHSGHGGDVTDLNSINFHLAPFSLSRHLTLSLLFQLSPASLFSGSLL